MNELKKLFNELWWLSDQKEPMEQFVEEIKTYCAYMGSEIQIAVIDLNDLGFQQGYIYIAYNDCNGDVNPTIYEASKFIEYYKEIITEHEEFEPERFWIKKLKRILEE